MASLAPAPSRMIVSSLEMVTCAPNTEGASMDARRARRWQSGGKDAPRRTRASSVRLGGTVARRCKAGAGGVRESGERALCVLLAVCLSLIHI
eukprot:4611159-Pleurochrysis_carterae.AAC.1